MKGHQIHYKIDSIWTSKIQYLAPFLKIYKGMKVIVTKNLYPKLGIVNRSIGYIENISITNTKSIN
jgi:ATP-dependent exoDNAse (exonuclease V) alpha subunit